MSVATQRAFLTTAFSDTSGGVRIAQYDSEDPRVLVLGEDADVSSLRDDVESWVDLRTTTGEVVGCCLLVDSADEANDLMDAHAGPSLALRGDDGTIALVYLFDRPIVHDGLETNCPLPSKGYSLAFDEDAPVDGEMHLVHLSPEDVLSWVVPTDPTTVPTERFNDATIYGVLDTEILNRKIVISRGTGRKCQKWVAAPMTIADFLHGVSVNKVGQKDGPSFTQGEIEGPERRGNLVTRQHIFGLDVDCGYDIETVHDMVTSLGLLTVIYTTHSHLTTTTNISESALNKWLQRNALTASAETCRKFLIEEKWYIPAMN